ncbi:MAG: TonB family protein [Rhodocyclaceae bacterium]|nr:TonB family protein [Rhodocyclaceae bacterium]
MTPSATRICLALTLSALLHLALLGGRWSAPAPIKPVRLEARLAIPEPSPAAPPAPPAPDIFEKNTLAPEETRPAPTPKPVPKAQAGKPARLKSADEQRAVRKLSEHILYPQAAIEAGHEGTVHLLLKFDASGAILEASVAAGSGYPELDHAALQSALRAGRLNTGGRTEIILPITFRLQ